MKRLNGWNRLWIVASCIWFVVGFIWTSSEWQSERMRPVSFAYERCTQNATANNTAWDECEKSLNAGIDDSYKGHITAGLVGGIAPPILLWLLIFAIIKTAGWIRRGGF
jgi:hypothetical protein